MADPLDAIVDADLEDRSPDELAASYRAICAMIMYRTALVAGQPAPPRRQEIEARAIARRWLAGERGIISFPEACMAVDVDPDAARRKVLAFADPAGPAAISRARRKPRNHYVFGRRAHVGSNVVTACSDSPAGGVGAGPANPAGHRRRPPGSGKGRRDRSPA